MITVAAICFLCVNDFSLTEQSLGYKLTFGRFARLHFGNRYLGERGSRRALS